MKPFRKTISVSLVVSLVLHALLAAVLWLQAAPDLKSLLAQTKPAEVELIDADQLLKTAPKSRPKATVPEGQIVQQSDKALNDEIPDDTRFLSAHNQKVVQQSQAMINGAFKNSDQSSGEAHREKVLGQTKPVVEKQKVAEETRAQKSKPEKSEPELLSSDDGPLVHGKNAKLKDLMPSFRPTAPQVTAETLASGGGDGPSATDDHLKDVKTGLQTVLSTREFVYYTYYNRIRSKLTQYWQPKVREKMERILKQGRTIASTGDKITRIVIILDDKGVLRKVQVLGASGVVDLDDAAVEAFRAAAPFPNPPKGMVDSDGTIKIRWDFVLEA